MTRITSQHSRHSKLGDVNAAAAAAASRPIHVHINSRAPLLKVQILSFPHSKKNFFYLIHESPYACTYLGGANQRPPVLRPTLLPPLKQTNNKNNNPTESARSLPDPENRDSHTQNPIHNHSHHESPPPRCPKDEPNKDEARGKRRIVVQNSHIA